MSVVGVRSIIDPLLKATRSKSVRWEQDDTGGFVVQIGKNTINVYELSSDGSVVEVRILGEDGKVVDFVNDLVSVSISSQLHELFDQARVNALNLDGIVEDILQHLNVAH